MDRCTHSHLRLTRWRLPALGAERRMIPAHTPFHWWACERRPRREHQRLSETRMTGPGHDCAADWYSRSLGAQQAAWIRFAYDCLVTTGLGDIALARGDAPGGGVGAQLTRFRGRAGGPPKKRTIARYIGFSNG